MELIIILIILRVIYSVFQSFQKKGEKPRPPQKPRRPTVSSPEPYFEDSKEMEALEGKETVVIPAAEPVLQSSFAEAEDRPLRRTAAGRGKADFLTAKKIPAARAVSSRRKKIGRPAGKHLPSRPLHKNNLLWGIVALEVLSPPRARNPFLFDRRKRQKGQREV